MFFDKFCVILIVESIKIKKILTELAKLKIIRRVDRCIGSTWSRNEVKVGSFSTLLYLLKSLSYSLFIEKLIFKSWVFTPSFKMSLH